MKSRQIGYALLLIALIIAEIYINNVVSLVVLLVAIILPIISLALCFRSKDALKVRMVTDDVVTKGEDLPVYLEFENTSGATIAYARFTINILNTLTGSFIQSPFATTISGKKVQKANLKVSESEIGQVYLTIKDFEIFDLFRLVSFRREVQLEDTVVVMPADIDVEAPQMFVTETEGESIRFSENNRGRDVSEVFDYRDYEPGDDIRAINWKLSGKRDELVIKEFSEPLNYSAIVLVDLVEAEPDRLEQCASVAAGVSRELLAQGVMHTLAFFDSGLEEFVFTNIENEEERELGIVRLICSCYSQNGPQSLERYLISDYRNPNSTLIYITTQVDEEALLAAAQYQPTRIYEA